MALSSESSVSAEPKFPSSSLSNAYQAGYARGCAKIAICPPTPSSAIPVPNDMFLYVGGCQDISCGIHEELSGGSQTMATASV